MLDAESNKQCFDRKKGKKEGRKGSSRCSLAETNLTVFMSSQVRSLALFSGRRVQCCHELWCRSQMQLGSQVAMAVVQASSYSSNSTLSLGTSICYGCSPKKTSPQRKKMNLCQIVSLHEESKNVITSKENSGSYCPTFWGLVVYCSRVISYDIKDQINK